MWVPLHRAALHSLSLVVSENTPCIFTFTKNITLAAGSTASAVYIYIYIRWIYLYSLNDVSPRISAIYIYTRLWKILTADLLISLRNVLFQRNISPKASRGHFRNNLRAYIYTAPTPGNNVGRDDDGYDIRLPTLSLSLSYTRADIGIWKCSRESRPLQQ